MDVKALIETTLKAEIIKALNAAPEAIEKLVEAAIKQEVDLRTGDPKVDSWTKSRGPYLDYLIGDEIRRAARDAVREVFASRAEEIKAAIRTKFSADDIVDAFAKALVGVGQQDWRVNVKFEAENKNS